MTMADWVERWAREHGVEVPPRDTAAWRELFLKYAGRNLKSVGSTDVPLYSD